MVYLIRSLYLSLYIIVKNYIINSIYTANRNMGPNKELIIVTPGVRSVSAGRILSNSTLYYCEVKSSYCLTGCEFCKNSCPCPSRRGREMERDK